MGWNATHGILAGAVAKCRPEQYKLFLLLNTEEIPLEIDEVYQQMVMERLFDHYKKKITAGNSVEFCRGGTDCIKEYEQTGELRAFTQLREEFEEDCVSEDF